MSFVFLRPSGHICFRDDSSYALNLHHFIAKYTSSTQLRVLEACCVSPLTVMFCR